MSRILTVLLFCTLSSLGSYADLSQHIHNKIARLAIEAEDVLDNKIKSNFFEFILNWENSLHMSRLESTPDKKLFLELSKEFKTFYDKKESIKLSDLSYFRIKIFKAGLSNYCSSDALMSDYISKKCGNCEAQTRMIISLIEPYLEKIDKRYKFSLQIFKDHIRPVLIDEDKDLLIDLVYGNTEVLSTTKANIYDYKFYYYSFLKSLYKTSLNQEDFLIYKSKSNFLNRQEVRSFDGYLKFGKQKGTFSRNADSPDSAIITYNEFNLTPQDNPERQIENEEIPLLSVDGENSTQDQSDFRSIRSEVLNTARLFKNYPDFKYANKINDKDFPFEVEQSDIDQLQSWFKVSSNFRFPSMPSATLMIHNEKLFERFQASSVIKRNNLLYSIYKRYLVKLYMSQEYSDLIRITENPSEISKLTILKLDSLISFSKKFSKALKFRHDYSKRVLGGISLGLESIWKDVYRDLPIQEYVQARIRGANFTKGNEVKIIKEFSKIKQVHIIKYFEIERNLRLDRDYAFDGIVRSDSFDLLRTFLSKKDIELTTKRKFDLSKVIFSSLPVIDEKKVGQKVSLDSPGQSEKDLTRINKVIYFGIYLTKPTKLYRNPRTQIDLLRNMNRDDVLEVSKFFSETSAFTSSLLSYELITQFLPEEVLVILGPEFLSSREVKYNSHRTKKVKAYYHAISEKTNESYFSTSVYEGIDMDGNTVEYNKTLYRNRCRENFKGIRLIKIRKERQLLDSFFETIKSKIFFNPTDDYSCGKVYETI